MRRHLVRRRLAGFVLAALLAACGLDDGARIRDRDGAGVEPTAGSADADG